MRREGCERERERGREGRRIEMMGGVVVDEAYERLK